MKSIKIIFLCLLAGASHPAWAMDRPENIPDNITEIKATQWYLEKYRSWRAFLTEKPTDLDGWHECFKAALYSKLSEDEMSGLLADMELHFPDSPELKLMKGRSKGWTAEGLNIMSRGLADLPKDKYLIERLLVAEFMKGDRLEWSVQLFASEKIYPSLMNYSYNVLMSVSENGALFVTGENTTIPLWILQDVYGLRRDVKILNTDLLQIQEYRQRIFESFGLKMTEDPFDLPEAHPDIPFFYALTISMQEIEFMQDRLYIVGLTSLLSEHPIDNYMLLRENIEEKFLLDYLTVDFNGEPKTATGRMLETNYIAPFYLLKQYYDREGDIANSGRWQNIIRDLAERSQLSGRINMLLAKENVPKNFKTVEIDVKRLDKELMKVKDNIYAKSFELTNREYGEFLDYLESNSYKDLLEIAEIKLDKYNDTNRQFYTNYHFNHKTSPMNYGDYPVFNITHEAAKLYCEWLTSQYNEQKGRRFKKVKFRLPTKNEWTMAALGYKDFQSWIFEDNIIRLKSNGRKRSKEVMEYRLSEYKDLLYPWYSHDWENLRSSIKNEKGCYLANVKVPEDIVCPSGAKGDGFIIASPVGSYFSNKMGLYDVIGNVAEMTDEAGTAMGGSYSHVPEESTITSINHYNKSDPAVGLRLFMEVIEE